MERDEDQGWEGEEAVTVGLYRMSAQENSLLGREAGVQALFAVSHSLRLQGYHEEGGPTNGLYGYVG